NTDKVASQKSYFTGLWESLWLSASLVNPHKFPAVGSYGVILDIPPQLILKTYQLDSTTPVHSDLMERASRGEDLNQFVRDYIVHSGCWNSTMVTDEHGGPIPKRIYAPGETDDSPHFMTPDEMITRGRPLKHNEIKFVPKGIDKGIEYRIGLSGIWYRD